MIFWNAGVLTEKGKALLTKVQAGTATMAITKAQTGSGQYDSSDDLEARTALKSPRQNLPINSKQVKDEFVLSLKIAITNKLANEELQQGYTIREIGIFANDPDEGEILYSIATAQTPDTLPAYDGHRVAVIYCEYMLKIGNTDNVTINTAGAFVVAEDLVWAQGSGLKSGIINGSSSTATGDYAVALNDGNDVEGNRAVAQGHGTKASGKNQMVMGKWNVEDTNDTYAAIIGGGTANNRRANIFTVNWDGDTWLAGDLAVAGDANITGDVHGKNGYFDNVYADNMEDGNGNKFVTDADVMTGATASAAGKKGLVPAPASAARKKYLRGDATWQNPIDDITVFTAATASSPGAKGLVPAPQAGDQGRFLAGDGEFHDIQFDFDAGVTGVKGSSESSYRTGQVNITKANIGLGNVDNTADANKNVAHAVSADSATTAQSATTATSATSATTAASATKASKDGNNQDIVSTYIKTININGKKITGTRGNGTTFDIGTTQDTTYSAATQTAQGLMSAADKKKLDGIATGATKVTVDSSLSTSSTNPVQNKLITAEVNKKAVVSVVRVSVPTSGWTQNSSTNAYEQSVTVSGLLTTDDKRTRVEMVGSTNVTTHANIEKAFGCINYVACNAAGKLYLRCDKSKPATTFSVDVVIVR